MKLLPFEHITYQTKLNEVEVIQRIANAVEPKKAFRLKWFGSSPTKPYEGEINGRQFRINRIIRYRNSFLPMISGTIRQNPDRTIIEVNMQPHIAVIVFTIIWCSGMGLACIAGLVTMISEKEFHPIACVPFGMLLFMYALTMGGFKWESGKSKKDLQDIFAAEIIG